MTGDELRQGFLDFFAGKAHSVRPSSPLIPKDDPTLLFANAGMNQFKDEFLGQGTGDLKRVATCQKCLRTSDIENVGITPRHVTFLEMLGNFSFGDYFKQDAISLAWEFVTGELKLSSADLWVTVFRDDDEAAGFWQSEAGVPAGRILRMGEDTNFWEMGPTGPCGPCSEIIVDMGEERGCGRPDCDARCECDRWLELWNLVFMQFDRREDGSLDPLPQKNIDTGMGLERAALIVQSKDNVFETDLFQPLVRAIEEATGERYGRGRETDGSFEVIVDHLRAVTFAMADGAVPSNEGRGYVLRRLVRRAMERGRTLGIKREFLYPLVSVVADHMKQGYPDLPGKCEHVARMVKAEEERFLAVFDRLPVLEEELGELAARGECEIPGELYFRYYDTYGIPRDTVRELAARAGLRLDEDAFEQALEGQRQRARGARGAEDLRYETQAHPALRVVKEPTGFVGYEQFESDGKVLAIVRCGETVGKAGCGEDVDIVLDRTVFYGEVGGQVGDTGVLEKDGAAAAVNDARHAGRVIVHCCRIERGTFSVGDSVRSRVDVERRMAIARNHTATHLLQGALRGVLGDHVHQSGSYVGPDRLRFDFSHFAAVTQGELDEVERRVNGSILENLEVTTRTLPLGEARKMGATALFGEKYEDEVRMVDVEGASRELCGGTHLAATGETGLFRLLGESSIGSGLRRIEAVTGREAYEMTRRDSLALQEVADILRSSPAQVVERVKSLAEKTRALEKKLEKSKASKVLESKEDILARAQEVAGTRLIAARLDGTAQAELRRLIDWLKKKMGSGVVVLASVQGDKIAFAAGVTPDLVEQGVHAGSIIKEVAGAAGGSGGGRPDMAQAGGRDVSLVDKALALVPGLVTKGMDKKNC